MNLPTVAVHLLLSSAALAMLVSASCNGPWYSGPSLSDVTLASALKADNQPLDAVSSFYMDAPQVCCSALLSGAHAGTLITADWWHIVNSMGGKVKTLLHEDGISREGDGYMGFTLAPPPSGLAPGDYLLELSIDGISKAKLTFGVLRDGSTAPPKVNLFSAQLLKLVAGQACTLKWSVTGASRVTIEPSIGSVAPDGSKDVTPAADTTYTLWAVNRSGSSQNSLTVAVTQPVVGRADLLISDFWSSGNFISYRIKNTGDLVSCPTETYLYKNDILESDDYVAPLQPGEERVEQFGRYHFSPRFPGTSNLSLTEAMGSDINIRVCANGGQACPESSSTNNCLERNFGVLLNVNLLQFASVAQWDCSSGMPNWAISPGANQVLGSIPYDRLQKDVDYPESLLVSPPSTGGWIQGTFGVSRGYPVTIQPFYIPHKCKLSARIGLTKNTPNSTKVKFTFGTAQGSDINYFPSVTVTTGKLQTYEADLSQLAGQKVGFILRVESIDPLPQGSAVWAEPVLIQQP